MLSDVYFPRVNGVSSSIRTCACALAAMGHRITLIAPDYGPEHNDPHDHDFEVIRLPSRTIFFDPEDRLIKSAALQAVLPALGARRWDVIHIHTGLALGEFVGGDGGAFRAQHGIEASRPTLVTVSRLAMEKKIDFLLHVVQRLVVEFPELLFIIAGEGPDAGRLKKLSQTLGLKDNVRFFGNLDRRTTLLDCYKAGDVFVFASPTETQGLVLIEAMALGVPIVSTAVMGTATVLRDASSAVIAAEDVSAFTSAVAQVLRDPLKRKALAVAGPRDAQGWSVDVLMHKTGRCTHDWLQRVLRPYRGYR